MEQKIEIKQTTKRALNISDYPLELHDELKELLELAKNSRSKNTIATYKNQMKYFFAYLTEKNFDFETISVGLYLKALYQSEKLYHFGTICIAKVAILQYAKHQEIHMKELFINNVLLGIKKQMIDNGRFKKKVKRGFSLDELQIMLTIIENTNKDKFNGDFFTARDQFVFLIMFWGALRKMDLSNLHFEHISQHQLGYSFFLPKSKSDRQANGSYFAIFSRPDLLEKKLCPATAFNNYLQILKKYGFSYKKSFVFQSLESFKFSYQKAFSREALPYLLKKYNIPISSHDFKHAFIQQAQASGFSRIQIAQATRNHVSSLEHYYKPIETLEKDNIAYLIGK